MFNSRKFQFVEMKRIWDSHHVDLLCVTPFLFQQKHFQSCFISDNRQTWILYKKKDVFFFPTTFISSFHPIPTECSWFFFFSSQFHLLPFHYVFNIAHLPVLNIFLLHIIIGHSISITYFQRYVSLLQLCQYVNSFFLISHFLLVCYYTYNSV